MNKSDYERAHGFATRYVRANFPEEGEKAGDSGPSGIAWWAALSAYKAGIRAERRARIGVSWRGTAIKRLMIGPKLIAEIDRETARPRYRATNNTGSVK